MPSLQSLRALGGVTSITTVVLFAMDAGAQDAPSKSSSTLSPLIVESSALEDPEGPVDGYRATRTTTVTRTDAAIHDLPFDVQVVTRESIDDRASVELSDALDAVPGVLLGSTSSNRGESFLIRGFDNYAYAIDGFLLNSANDRPETFLDLANVERVEVLKGPASALYGRGQPGGLINVVTRKPSDTFTADAEINAGSYDYYRSEGSVSGPLNDSGTLAGRVTLAGQTDGGFRDSPRSDSERQFGSVALRWEPDALTRFDFSVDHTHQHLPFDRGLVVTPDNDVTLPRDRFLSESWSQVDASVTRWTVGAERIVNSWLTLRADARYDDAKIRDTGIDSRGLLDDGRTLERRYTDRAEDSNNLDLRLEAVAEFATGTLDHQLLLGSEYIRSELGFLSARASIDPIDIYEPVYGATRPPAELNASFDATSELFSTYVQDLITLSPQWKLLAGLRHDQVSQRRHSHIDDDDPSIDQSKLNGRVGLVYQPIEPLSLYTSYAESFSPQLGLAKGGGALDPEEGEQIEVGAKWDVSDQIAVTASVFEITKKNVATTDPSNPGADYSLLSGEQRVRGAELSVAGEPVTGWQLQAGTSYLDARVTEDEELEEGNRLTGVPYWSASLWSTYRLQSGPAKGVKLGAGAIYVGERDGDLDNSYDVDGYHRFDASVSYPLTPHVEIALNVENLTDEEYIAAPVGRNENYPGAPLSVIAGLKFKL